MIDMMNKHKGIAVHFDHGSGKKMNENRAQCGIGNGFDWRKYVELNCDLFEPINGPTL